ncbi:MAG: prepilin peptidase, partial [Candidatus Gastranaerophilales bacterium]|nr:prepilin peptidase [Candidatus Gastranaerophilales bacterium]
MFEVFIAFLFGFFGLCFGSFGNVVIYRLPKKISLLKPGSHCPNCKKKIKWYDNLPLLSYLLLGGKCRNCKKGIGIRYLLVELLTGSL